MKRDVLRERWSVLPMTGLMFLMIAFALLLAGCSASTTSSESSISADSVVQSEKEQAEGEEEISTDNLISNYTVTEANEYSDGLCVVVTKELGPCLVNTEGKVVSELPTEEVSNYYDGFAAAALGSEGCDAILDSNGDVVWTLDSNIEAISAGYFDGYEVTNAVVSYGVENPFYGCLPIQFTVDSFDFTGFAYGIMGVDGRWLMEPRFQEDGAPRCEESYFIGEDYIYNFLTREVVEMGDASTSESIESVYRQNYTALHDGMMFEDSMTGDNEHFVNVSGETVLDLSGYSIYSFPEFVDGYALLGLYNDERSPYITVIDTAGNFLFSPIRNPYYTGTVVPWGEFAEGKFFLKTDAETDQKVDNGMFIGLDGKAIGTVRGDNATCFNGGLAWIDAGVDDSYICINDSGEPMFGFEAEPLNR